LESNVLEICLAKYRMYRDHGVHSGHDSTGNLNVGKKAIRYTEIIVKRTKGKGKTGEKREGVCGGIAKGKTRKLI
jgi:hypothetical protein